MPTSEPTPWSDVLIDGYAKILADKDGASFCAVFEESPPPYYAGLLQGTTISSYSLDFVPRDQAFLIAGAAMYYSVRDNCPDILADVESSLVANAEGDPFVFAGVY
ncbi:MULTISPECIES: hypothetical protein [unclassified Rathayibacter]|uniref:hypothetical protein n=1 Tax=unclassified Rathayibacter TaxID=2609250 RepID=UPI0011B04948|nr:MULTISPECIES: hypothetical protein [unclassified Rathayibacter]